MSDSFKLECVISDNHGLNEPCVIRITTPVLCSDGMYEVKLICWHAFRETEPVYCGSDADEAVAQALNVIRRTLRRNHWRLEDGYGAELHLPRPQDFDPDFPSDEEIDRELAVSTPKPKS